MGKNTRTKNVIRNILVGEFAQIITLILNFFNRTVFIKLLNAEYLGINGLFSNILTVLSFAELGIGSIIGFNLYKPLAEKDTVSIKKYMLFYKKAYNLIALSVLVLGILLIPFLPYTINQAPNIDENLVILYLLFLANTVISYFNVYKKSLLAADQKEYIVIVFHRIINCFQLLMQCIFLFLTHNYIIYLLIQIFCTFIDNLIISLLANKMYPYLKEHKINIKIDKSDIKTFFINIKAVAIKKFGAIILDGTDNIIISSILNLSIVGVYSNYTMIINAVGLITSQITNALTASVGNLNAVETQNKKESVFNEIFLLSAFIFGFCTLEIFFLINPFIKIWIGENYLLSQASVMVILLNLYLTNMSHATYSFRYTSGLFRDYQYTPFVASIINIILSILLGKKLGIFGVIIATSISRLLTYFWVDPLVVYKKVFNKNVREYFLNFFIYFSVTVIIGLIIKLLLIILPEIINIWMLFFYAILIGIIILIGFYLFFCRIKVGQRLLKRFYKIYLGIFNK